MDGWKKKKKGGEGEGEGKKKRTEKKGGGLDNLRKNKNESKDLSSGAQEKNANTAYS